MRKKPSKTVDGNYYCLFNIRSLKTMHCKFFWIFASSWSSMSPKLGEMAQIYHSQLGFSRLIHYFCICPGVSACCCVFGTSLEAIVFTKLFMEVQRLKQQCCVTS